MRSFRHIRTRHVALLTAGVVIGAFLVAGPSAGAGTLTTTTTVGHFSLAASAFAPDGLHNTTEDYFNEWDLSTLSNQDSGRCFDAGAVLPADATLTSVTFYYTESTTVMYVELDRQDLVNHTGMALASADTGTTTTPTYKHTTLSIPAADALVEPFTYAYSFGVCPSGTTTFSGVIVTYSVKS